MLVLAGTLSDHWGLAYGDRLSKHFLLYMSYSSIVHITMGRLHSLLLCLFCFVPMQITYAKEASIVNHKASHSITPASNRATVTIKTSTYTINPAHVVIASHTLLPGGAPILINGEEIRLDSSRNLIAGKTTLYHHHKYETKTSKAALHSNKDVKSRSTLKHSTVAPSRAAVPSHSKTAHQPTTKEVKTTSHQRTLSKAATKPTPHPKAKSDGSSTTTKSPVVVVPHPVVPGKACEDSSLFRPRK